MWKLSAKMYLHTHDQVLEIKKRLYELEEELSIKQMGMQKSNSIYID